VAVPPAARLPGARAPAAFHSSARHLAWGRFGGIDEPPPVSLGKSGTTPHVGVAIVPQQSVFVVERLGKFDRVLEPGLHFLIPLVRDKQHAPRTSHWQTVFSLALCWLRCAAALARRARLPARDDAA
jgi:hypothetical protein